VVLAVQTEQPAPGVFSLRMYPYAGSDGDGRSNNDAKRFDPATDLTLIDPVSK
jgi:hypothetical protein